MVRDIARIVAGLVIVVLLLLMVVRPLIKGLTPPPRPVMVAASPVPALPNPAEAQAQSPAVTPLPPPMPNVPFEQQLEQARTIVNADAPRVAQVLKEWVQNDV